MSSSPARGTTAPARLVEVVLGTYALLSSVAFLFPDRPPVWPVLLAIHWLAALLLLRPWPGGAPAIFRTAEGAQVHPREDPPGLGPRVLAVLRDWYPLLLVPFLYSELALLNLAVHGGTYFDPLVIVWEEAIFGGQPSRDWAGGFAALWLSEPLHAAYLSYYMIIYVPPVVLYLAGRREEFHRMVLAIMLTFAAHYLFFIYLPVQGPRYLFPPPTGGLEEGAVYRFTHRLLEAGSSQGAAFPSSHVGVSVAQTIACIRFLPRLAPAVGLLTLGLAAGAIYGGFHYAIDALAGAGLGALLGGVALHVGGRGRSRS